LKIARRDLRAVQRERTKWGDALAGLIAASIAAAEGRGDDVVRSLQNAQASFEALSMAAHAAAAGVRLGEWSGGAQGGTVVAEAEDGLDRLRELGAASPQRMARMLAPPVLGW
jgi:hypothetical protein